MRCLIAATICLVLLSLPAQAQEFMTLCYHDVEDKVGDPGGNAISSDRLVQHFSWLRANGFHVVSIDDLLAAQRGERPLPDKAVLLTFDDGYASFYTRVYPLLKAFGYPAVLAVVGSWLDAAADAQVEYDGGWVSRRKFISWEQLQEVTASGLVEIASHSYDLHYGVIANPQVNLEPALTSRMFDPETERYEDDSTHLTRIGADLARNSELLERRLGSRPRVMVWPFGRYHQPAMAIARELGMPVALTLESGASRINGLDQVRRFLVPGDLKIEDLAWELYNPDKNDPRRVAHIDLDYVYDTDPAQQEKNLDRLLDRIKNLKINTVFLQAFADPDGNGTADALYFPNRSLPVRADLFNRVSWQLKTRAGVNVYAWMPMLGFELGDASMTVQTQADDESPPSGYRRLSPFVPEARQLILEIYEDLARYADFDGLLFHDDGHLTDFEDVNPSALVWYRDRLQLPIGPGLTRSDPDLMRRWSEAKTQVLMSWSGELADKVRTWRPTIKTARNLYAEAALNPGSEAWYAQSLQKSLKQYDFAAIMAMPYMEQAVDPEAWLVSLVKAVKKHPGGLRKTIFELQTVDWNKRSRQIPSTVLGRQMRLLQRHGAVNFGYYPDDFIGNHPDAHELYRAISMQTSPYRSSP